MITGIRLTNKLILKVETEMRNVVIHCFPPQNKKPVPTYIRKITLSDVMICALTPSIHCDVRMCSQVK